MGVIGSAIGFLVVIVLIIVIASMVIGNLKVDTTTASGFTKDDFQKYLDDAVKLAVKPTSTEDVCDLKVTVYGELHGFTAITNLQDDLNPLPANLKVLLGQGTSHPYVKKYEWFNCNPSTQVPLASLLNFGVNMYNDPPLQALFVTQETIHAQIVLKSGVYKVDAVTQPSLKKAILIPAGNVPLPFDLTAVFVVTDIPNRDYDMEIYYGQEINDLQAGQPYLTKVCQSGKTSC